VVFFTLGGQPNTDERLKGFKEVLATRPDIHIIDVVDIKGDARNAFDWTQSAMPLSAPRKSMPLSALKPRRARWLPMR